MQTKTVIVNKVVETKRNFVAGDDYLKAHKPSIDLTTSRDNICS